MMKFDVKFRAFRTGDAAFVNALRNQTDREKKVGGSKRFVSLDREEKWIEDLIMSDSSQVNYFAITKSDSDEIIGYTSVSNIDFRNGTCFWSGIKLSPDVAGLGYGLQVALLVLDYVFNELRMVRCTGECQEDHEVALKLMKKAGYSIEGLMRNYLYKNGKHINTWLLSVTDVDYLAVKEKYDII